MLQNSDELELIAAILIALFAGAYIFKSVGLTGELGALILGILLSNHEAADRLSKKIWSLRELLLLAFFVSLGMNLRIDSQTVLFSLVLVGMLVLKSAILFFLLNGYCWFCIHQVSCGIISTGHSQE